MKKINTEGMKIIFLLVYVFRFMSFMNKINDGSKVIVFCETKRGVDDLTKSMRNDGWHAVKGIHGDKS